jgi:hypothetical protein
MPSEIVQGTGYLQHNGEIRTRSTLAPWNVVTRETCMNWFGLPT